MGACSQDRSIDRMNIYRRMVLKYACKLYLSYSPLETHPLLSGLAPGPQDFSPVNRRQMTMYAQWFRDLSLQLPQYFIGK